MFIIMPTTTSIQNQLTKFNREIISLEQTQILQGPSVEDYDGTILGGIGRIYKENGEWKNETHGYLVGVYKEDGNNKKIYGHLYNLEKEQTGYIRAHCSHSIIIGTIKNMEDKKVPIVGFLFFKEEKFFGRIMSLFGPAPHIWGKYTPN
jgi:hypothetical protein